MLDVLAIDDPVAAAAAIDPVRSRLLAELRTPASAAALAARLGIPRQELGYHLRALEAHGLVRETDRRRWGGLTERVLEATASSYVVSPAAMGPAATDPGRAGDRLSASYLVALGARVVREASALIRRAAATGKRLATSSIDTEIRFRSAAERAAFSRELTETVAALAAKYHDASVPQGREHRLVIVAHPLPRAGATNEETRHEREDRTRRPPHRRARARAARHAGAGRAGDRHRPGHQLLVLPDRRRGARGRRDRLPPRPGAASGGSRGTVTTWQPPRRFDYVERDWMAGAPPVAAELVVEARAGGVRVVRLVHSLFADGSDWDEQLESFEAGWPPFFRILRLILERLPDQRRAPVRAAARSDLGETELWRRLTAALGVADAGPGSHVETGGPDLPRFGGVVVTREDRAAPRELLLRLDAPAPGIALAAAADWIGKTHGTVALSLFGAGAQEAARREQHAWQSLLARL